MRLLGFSGTTDIEVAGDTIWLFAGDSSSINMVELAAVDGAVRQVANVNLGFASAGVGPDGSVYIGARNNSVKLTPALAVDWSVGIDGQDAVLDGDTLWLPNGVGMTKMSTSGVVDWIAIPDFENASEPRIAGARVLSDGRVVVGVGNNGPALAPLLAAAWTRDGQMSWFKKYGPDLNPGFTQFGDGEDIATRGDTTFFGLIANGGGVGGVRGRVVVEVDANGDASAALNSGTGVAVDSAGRVWTTNGDTLYRSATNEGCDKIVDPGASVDVETTQIIFTEGNDAQIPGSTPTVSPLAVTEESLAVELVSSCP